jgi:DNA-directed RNA polymerase subunit RPC12/RpoP
MSKISQLKNDTLPNCEECAHLMKIRKGFLKRIVGAVCKAQGYKSSPSAYNTVECRKLFIKTKGEN